MSEIVLDFNQLKEKLLEIYKPLNSIDKELLSKITTLESSLFYDLTQYVESLDFGEGFITVNYLTSNYPNFKFSFKGKFIFKKINEPLNILKKRFVIFLNSLYKDKKFETKSISKPYLDDLDELTNQKIVFYSKNGIVIHNIRFFFKYEKEFYSFYNGLKPEIQQKIINFFTGDLKKLIPNNYSFDEFVKKVFPNI